MINYSLTLLPSKPGDKTGEKLFYARMQSSGTVDIEEIASDISYATTLTDSDVLASIRAFIHQLNKHLKAGKIVRAGDLGSFQLQIHSEGAKTEKEFSEANITGVSIQFRGGGMVRNATTRAVGGLEFRKVPKRKDAASSTTGGDDNTGGGSPGGGGSDPLA